MIRIALNDFQDSKELQEKIKTIAYSGGRTGTAQALRVTSRELFKYALGGRPGIPKVLILVTDGASTNNETLRQVARELWERGIMIYVVGVGDLIKEEELKDITASDSNIFKAKDFDTMALIAPPLVKKIVGDLNGRFSVSFI